MVVKTVGHYKGMGIRSLITKEVENVLFENYPLFVVFLVYLKLVTTYCVGFGGPSPGPTVHWRGSLAPGKGAGLGCWSCWPVPRGTGLPAPGARGWLQREGRWRKAQK